MRFASNAGAPHRVDWRLRADARARPQDERPQWLTALNQHSIGIAIVNSFEAGRGGRWRHCAAQVTDIDHRRLPGQHPCFGQIA
jgi:hypothetical protein